MDDTATRTEVIDDDNFFTYKTNGSPFERMRRAPRRVVHLLPVCTCVPSQLRDTRTLDERLRDLAWRVPPYEQYRY